MNRAIVIGAGIVGLATTKALAGRGYQVTVIERSPKAIGASIRNFGMIWPIGQPDGELYERAVLSKQIWKDVCRSANIWHDEVGSLHLAYGEDEWRVLQELQSLYAHRQYNLLNAEQTTQTSSAVNPKKLIGGLYSTNEMIIDPREAIEKIPLWLNEKYGVHFIWGKAVTDVSYPAVYSGKEEFEADLIYVCSGVDFETLYPEYFSRLPLVKCKLQMMRMETQPANWRMGPALCGGLSLVHYHSFKAAPSLIDLRKRFETEYPEYLKWGIHVMAAQNQAGEITIGDSHEYDVSPDPFDKHHINELIISYLDKFASFPNKRILQSWNGLYAKLTDGRTEIVLEPERGVTIINGIGGNGMTLSFALCDQLVSKKVDSSPGFFPVLHPDQCFDV